MKTMWTSEGGVSQVGVFKVGDVEMAESADGHQWSPEPGTIHETETDAKRAWLREQEARHENDVAGCEEQERDVRERMRALALDLEHLAVTRGKALAALGEVRAQLAELDAVEGRR